MSVHLGRVPLGRFGDNWSIESPTFSLLAAQLSKISASTSSPDGCGWADSGDDSLFMYPGKCKPAKATRAQARTAVGSRCSVSWRFRVVCNLSREFTCIKHLWRKNKTFRSSGLSAEKRADRLGLFTSSALCVQSSTNRRDTQNCKALTASSSCPELQVLSEARWVCPRQLSRCKHTTWRTCPRLSEDSFVIAWNLKVPVKKGRWYRSLNVRFDDSHARR